jgi:hypothetical protein
MPRTSARKLTKYNQILNKISAPSSAAMLQRLAGRSALIWCPQRSVTRVAVHAGEVAT